MFLLFLQSNKSIFSNPPQTFEWVRDASDISSQISNWILITIWYPVFIQITEQTSCISLYIFLFIKIWFGVLLIIWFLLKYNPPPSPSWNGIQLIHWVLLVHWLPPEPLVLNTKWDFRQILKLKVRYLKHWFYYLILTPTV